MPGGRPQAGNIIIANEEFTAFSGKSSLNSRRAGRQCLVMGDDDAGLFTFFMTLAM